MKTVTKPSKQRKMLFQASGHVRHKHFAAPLSPELRASHRTRTLPVRSGDTVRITRGDRKGFEGKVSRVDRKKYRVYVEGLTREKVDGTTIFLPIHPSKIVITNLNLEDKWRKQILERKRRAHMIIEKAVEKPSSEKLAEIREAEEAPKKETKRKKKKVTRKLAEKEKEKKRKRPKKVKKARKKKTEVTEKEEKSKARRIKATRKTIKKKPEG